MTVEITSTNLNELTVMQYRDGVVIRTVGPGVKPDVRTTTYLKGREVLDFVIAVLTEYAKVRRI